MWALLHIRLELSLLTLHLSDLDLVFLLRVGNVLLVLECTGVGAFCCFFCDYAFRAKKS